MDYSKIGDTANRLSGMTGPSMFIFSGIGVSFNYYVSSSIPIQLISGMYFVILASSVAMAFNLIQSRKNPHQAVGEKCPKCQKPIIYSSLKCSNPNCNYKVKLE